jgi:heptosyltransferase I
MTKKHLVILPNNLGDVIMALPVLEGLKKNTPDAHVTFFVEQGYEGGLVGSPFCDRIFTFDRKAVRDAARTPDWRSSIATMDGVVGGLTRERFDRVVNLSQHAYTSFLATLLSGKETVGRRYARAGNHCIDDAWSRYLYAIPFSRACNRLHATDVYRAIAGVGSTRPEQAMRVTEGERQKAAEYLLSKGVAPGEKPLMVLQPGAAYAAKQWPLDHFAALGTRLAADGCRIVITGAPAEAEIAAALGAQLGPAAVVTAGSLTFRETIALLPLVSGCVSGDTAIMHAAAGLGRKVFALFGPTNPVETGPYGEGHIVFAGRCTSRPCFCFDCKTKMCMKSIAPGDVYAFINDSAHAAAAGCDVYRTGFNADGNSCLEPVVEQGQPFYHEPAASLTIRVPDPAYTPRITAAPDAAASVKKETAYFLEKADAMEQALAEFAAQRSNDTLRRFEKLHAECGTLSGIGAFWTALLNLRLNSVPLLDPIAGVKHSLDACAATRKEVSAAVSILP